MPELPCPVQSGVHVRHLLIPPWSGSKRQARMHLTRGAAGAWRRVLALLVPCALAPLPSSLATVAASSSKGRLWITFNAEALPSVVQAGRGDESDQPQEQQKPQKQQEKKKDRKQESQQVGCCPTCCWGWLVVERSNAYLPQLQSVLGVHRAEAAQLTSESLNRYPHIGGHLTVTAVIWPNITQACISLR